MGSPSFRALGVESGGQKPMQHKVDGSRVTIELGRKLGSTFKTFCKQRGNLGHREVKIISRILCSLSVYLR